MADVERTGTEERERLRQIEVGSYTWADWLEDAAEAAERHCPPEMQYIQIPAKTAQRIASQLRRLRTDAYIALREPRTSPDPDGEWVNVGTVPNVEPGPDAEPIVWRECRRATGFLCNQVNCDCDGPVYRESRTREQEKQP